MDLRSKAVPVAPAAAPPVWQNRMPLPAGSVMSLSPGEQADLERLGWKPGDPVPDLTEAVEQVRLAAENAPLPDASLPVIKPGQVVNIEDLPPERQAELMAQVQQMVANGRQLEAMQANFVQSPSDPSVNKAIETVQAGQDTYNVTLTEPVPEAPQPELSTAAPVKHTCDNCGWGEALQQEIVEVSDLDKQNFLAMLIGDVRFIREYTLFGGQVVVAFRSLTQQELDMCITQATYDARDGEIVADYDIIRTSRNYELALSLHRLQLGARAVTMPFIQDVQADEKTADGRPQTKVKSYYQYVMRQHLHKEALFRATQVVRDKFVKLQTRLEANMHSPDFYSGIVPRA